MTTNQTQSSVILITDALGESDDLQARLEDLGWSVRAKASNAEAGIAACRALSSESSLAVIDSQSGTLDLLGLIGELSRDPGCPTLLLARQLPPHIVRDAVEQGASQIVFHPCGRQTLAAALWTVSARGRDLAEARRDAETLRQSLEERKRVEIAKGLLMESKGMSEQAAYEALRRTSQTQRVPLTDLAAIVIETGDLPVP